MTKKKKHSQTRQYKVRVKENSMVEGKFAQAGSIVSVSKDYYERVQNESDYQLEVI